MQGEENENMPFKFDLPLTVIQKCGNWQHIYVINLVKDEYRATLPSMKFSLVQLSMVASLDFLLISFHRSNNHGSAL